MRRDRLVFAVAVLSVAGFIVAQQYTDTRNNTTQTLPTDAEPPYTQPTSEQVMSNHVSALDNFENGSRTVRRRYSGGPLGIYGLFFNRPSVVSTFKIKFSSDGNQLRKEYTFAGELDDVHYYYNNSSGVEKSETENETNYDRVDSYKNASKLGPVLDLIEAANLSRSPVRRNGRTVFHYSASGIEPEHISSERPDRNEWLNKNASPIESASVDLFVRPSV
nr:MAG: hypothetical protein J07AB56_01370 [Candidatus Nanosalinarum sp. J07AB56]